MNTTIWIIIVLFAILLIAGIAYLLYRVGFQITKMKVKTLVVDVEAERKQKLAENSPKTAVDYQITAKDGGKVKNSPITDKSKRPNKVNITADGKESSISGSSVNIE